MGLELARAFIRVRGDSSRLAGDFGKMKAKASGALRGIATMATGILAGVGVTAGVAGFVGLVRSGETFNQKMRQSLAIMGDVSDALKNDMRQAAFTAARATRFAASEAAEAFFFLASAGLDAVQSIAAMPQVAQFAQAGNFDLARATDLATDAQSALGLTVKDAGKNLENLTRVTDVLVKANTLANASVEQFALAITSKGGAATRGAGKDLEELTAVLAAFADQGTKAQEAGTAINIILRELQTKSIQNKSAFEKFGVEVFDASGKMKNMADIVENLEKALVGMEAKQRKATLASLGFADKSVIFIQTLLGTSNKIREYEKELRKAGGTTKEVADKQLTPMQKGTAKLGAAFTEASSDLMKWAGPILGRAMSRFAGWFKFIRAGFSLFRDLIASVADFFSAAWEVSFRFVKKEFGSFVNSLTANFKTVLGNIDVMLGSWEGLRDGIIMGVDQAALAFKATWKGVVDFFAIQITKMTGLVEKLFLSYIELSARAALELHFKKDTPELVRTAARAALGFGFDQARLNVENKTNDLVKDMRTEHEKEMTKLGQESLDLTEKWKKKLGELPRLSDKFRDKWKKVNELVAESVLPELLAPELPGVGGAGGLGGAGMAGGRLGFAEFGKSIQDAVLQKSDPVLKENEKQTKELKEIKEEIKKQASGINPTVLVAGDG